MSFHRALLNVLFLNVVLVVCVDVFLIGSVPAFGWDSLHFWLHESKQALEGVLSTEYKNGEWTHPQPRTLIELIKACTALGVPYQYVWLVVSMAFMIAAIGGLQVKNAAFALFLALAAMVLSAPLWESHLVIVGYADLLIATVFGFALKFARNALAKSSKIDFAIFVLICSTLPFIKNTGTAYAVLLVITLVQARYWSTLAKLKGVIMLLVMLLIFNGPSAIRALNQDFSFLYAGNELVTGNHSGIDIARNWWNALFKNMSFSILPTLVIIAMCNVFSNDNQPEIYLPVFAIINLFGMLTVSQWFDYGFVHALPGHDTGNSRFFLPMVAATVFIIYDILRAQDFKQKRLAVSIK